MMSLLRPLLPKWPAIAAEHLSRWEAHGRCCVVQGGGSRKSFRWFDQMATVSSVKAATTCSGVVVFLTPSSWYPRRRFWDERVPCGDHSCAAELFEAAHRRSRDFKRP
jgi:hypothetical protein